ncbi:hypothetical protein GOHSU_13_00550 [Gordonia hirsuta DSM 44140 = NBRC 16056]|uniref:Methyltransferase type 11 domain-containing protein n=1 Tax=Gordonia hirsuta DSM 44140 = NBRC 16056 TaxID=1121927 RepID=L7L9W8_9ACTN|nr:mycofactocin oligosaccharide methyltransferase MftM [Gordonia hirsuta]GAC56833.1 hypothetical protein GOHSU_13_00550 [Gordonia hirsuta DSM 44140 = NBRC 16056]
MTSSLTSVAPTATIRVRRRLTGSLGSPAWTDQHVFTGHRDGRNVYIAHPLTAATVADHRLVDGLGCLREAGVLQGQAEFEDAFVQIVRSCGSSPEDGWAAFYRNSLAALHNAESAFSPIHRRAREVIAGSSVLEVGSCFGLLALQLAVDGHAVTAVDVCPGAIDLLGQASAGLGIALQAVPGDARALPFGDDSFDTVTLIHLLEHLSSDSAQRSLVEAARVARRRVVVAVPYEDEPDAAFGHVQALTESDLLSWAKKYPGWRAAISEHHGGWLILDRR